MGCDPSQGYFQKRYQAQEGTAKDIFQPCEKIIKDGLSSSQMHAFRSGKPCFHMRVQIDYHSNKTQLLSHLIVFFFSSFLRVWLPF